MGSSVFLGLWLASFARLDYRYAENATGSEGDGVKRG